MKYIVAIALFVTASCTKAPAPPQNPQPSPQLLKEHEAIGAFNALFTQANLKQRANDHEHAAELFRAAIAAMPDKDTTAVAWNDLGWSLLQLKKPQEAVVAFQKAIALQPANQKARNNLVVAQKEAANAAAPTGPTGKTAAKPAPVPAPAPAPAPKK